MSNKLVRAASLNSEKNRIVRTDGPTADPFVKNDQSFRERLSKRDGQPKRSLPQPKRSKSIFLEMGKSRSKSKNSIGVGPGGIVSVLRDLATQEEAEESDEDEEGRGSLIGSQAQLQQYVMKVEELFKGGMLTEQRRKQLKEGLLLGNARSVATVESKYEMLLKFQTISSTVNFSSSSKRGVLFKKPQIMLNDKAFFTPSWKRRYFVLRPVTCQLVYYETEADSLKAPASLDYEALGEIDLTTGLRISEIETDVTKPKSFSIKTDLYSIELKASDEAELDDWMNAFAEARTAYIQQIHKKLEEKDAHSASGQALKRAVRSRSLEMGPRHASMDDVELDDVNFDWDPKLEDIDLSGILVKRGASIRNWKARYFLVRGEHIIYFKHETDNTPIGQISFKDIPSMENIRRSWLKRYCFKIQTMKRTYYMMCQSAEEQRHWIKVLRSKMKKYFEEHQTERTLWESGRDKNELSGSLKGNTYRARQLFQQETARRDSKKMKNRRQSNMQLLMEQDAYLSQCRTRALTAQSSKVFDKEEVINYDIWNHREEITYLPDPMVLIGKERQRDDWFQFEVFLEARDIEISDEFYKSFRSSRNFVQAVTKTFKSKSQTMHSSMSAENDAPRKLLPNGAPRPVLEKNLRMCTHVVVYMSKPTVETKDFLRKEAIRDDFFFHRISRTESRNGSCDCVFSVATLLTLPLSAATVESFLLWRSWEDDAIDESEINEDGTQVEKLEAIIRLEVRVKVNQEQKTFVYGTSDFFLTDVLSALRRGEDVSCFVRSPQDVTMTNNIRIGAQGSKARTTIRPFWPKFFSKKLPSAKAIMAQSYLFNIPNPRSSFLVGQDKKGMVLYAREEVVESAIAFAVPDAWIRLRSAEWSEEQRKLQKLVKMQNLGFKPQKRAKEKTNPEKETLLDLNNGEWRYELLQEQTQILDNYLHLMNIYPVFQHFVDICSMRGWRDLSFKSSKKKKHPDFAFVATNLHTQLFTVSADPIETTKKNEAKDESATYMYEFITTGAPAAHHLGFDNGGLCRARDNLEEMIRSLEITVHNNLVPRERTHSAVTSDADAIKEALELEDIMNLLMEDSESSKHFFHEEMTKRISTHAQAVKHREDVVLSQTLSGLAEAFRTKIYLYMHNREGVDWRWTNMWDIFENCGFLYELESLLSTRGNEQGMLEDAFGGIRSLKFCQLSVAKDDPDKDDALQENENQGAKQNDLNVVTVLDENSDGSEIDNVAVNDMRFYSHYTRSARSGSVKITRLCQSDPSNGGGLLITVFVPTRVFSVLPKKVRDGYRFSCKPLMFTQGINEQQTLENRLGKKRNLELQTKINLSSYRGLREYCKSFGKCASKLQVPESDMQRARNMLVKVERHVNNAKPQQKSCAVLMTSANLVRFLAGSRATCCKSAKDRTSMSVTHEEARCVVGLESSQKKLILSIANVLREFGVRIGNARKNVGKKKFAFNQLQQKFLPTEYKPPMCVAGNAVS
jgi:hypothetical protein